ncbi:MAG TPA: hypothetical protein VIK50_10515 [Gemmatimonadaceae bacterium]
MISTTLRIAVPVTRAWAFAMTMADPRMPVDTDHPGAGTRA